MKPGRFYERFKLADGREVILRALSSADLTETMRFANTLVRERSVNPNLGVLLDTRVSRREEKEWLVRRVKAISKGSNFSVAAFHGGRLVGNCEVVRQPFKDLRRCGTLGIAILDGYRGVGLGRRMLEVLLKAAGDGGVSLVELRVISINSRAVRLYKGLGFKRAGTIPKKILRGRRYIDEVLMFRRS